MGKSGGKWRKGRNRIKPSSLKLEELRRNDWPREWVEYIEMLKDSESCKRRIAAHKLGSLGYEKVVPYLMKALTDPDRLVRQNALDSLIAKGKFREAIDYISNIDFRKLPMSHHLILVPLFYRGPPPKVPLEVFSKAMEERRMVREKAKREGKLKEWYEKNYHRGVPIYVADISSAGQYYHGRILVSKGVPDEFRDIIAEHEIGEYVSHDMGNAMALKYAERKGKIREYLEWRCRDKTTEEIDLIKKYLPELEKYIPKAST